MSIRNNLEFALGVLVAIVAFDFMMFMFWVFSGQVPPPDSFYFGSFTASILRLVI